jgi:hypothetical protein
VDYDTIVLLLSLLETSELLETHEFLMARLLWEQSIALSRISSGSLSPSICHPAHEAVNTGPQQDTGYGYGPHLPSHRATLISKPFVASGHGV